LNGYKVEIEGDETYSFLPPRINGFRSAVYTIGGKGCSNFNLFFGTEAEGVSAANPPAGKHKHQQQ
jgi:hypothetical protein